MSDHQPPTAPPAPSPEPVVPEIEGPQQDEGLLETAITVFVSPVEALKRVTSHPRVEWAIAISMSITLLSSITSAAGFRNFEQPPGMGLELPPLPVLIIAAAIFGPIFGLISLAFGTGVLQVMSLMLGGKGPYKGLFVGLAFATVPTIVQIPIQLVALVGGPAGQALVAVINFAVTIWVVCLAVIAVRENNNFSTGRAVATVLIPIAVLFVVILVLVLVAVALTIGTITG